MPFKEGSKNIRWQGNKGPNNPMFGKKQPALSERNRRGKGPNGPLCRYTEKDGYIKLLRPIFPGHEEYSRNKSGNWFALEHIVIMARYLKRALKPGETVHHKNGIRHDNNLMNLELWAKSHPAGQRVVDVFDWAKLFVSQYEKEIDDIRR